MSAYLVEVDDTKSGVTSPLVIGPFRDAVEAGAFADELDLGTAAQSGQGGYSACHVISDDTCDYTPDQYRAEHRETYGEDG